MITLKQIAAMHMDRFAGGDRKTSSKLSYQEVVFNTRFICNELLKAEYFTKMQNGDRSNVLNCIAVYELPLQNDLVDGVAYVTLPEFYISLPYNRGVHRIFQRAKKIKGESQQSGITEFTLVDQPAVSLRTRTLRYPGMNYCWIEGFKVKFFNMYAEADATNKVIAQLIVAAPDNIAETAALPIMPEIIPRVLDRLAQMELNPALKVEMPK